MQNRSKPVKTHAWAVTLIFPLIILAIGTGFVCYYRGWDAGRKEISEKIVKMNQSCQDCMISIRNSGFLQTEIQVTSKTTTVTTRDSDGNVLKEETFIPSQMPQEVKDKIASGEIK